MRCTVQKLDPLPQALNIQFEMTRAISSSSISFRLRMRSRTVVIRPSMIERAWATSLVWVICAVSLQFTLGFTSALLLNRSFAWRGIARALVVVPWALPSVIIGLIWTWMLDFNLGVLNNIGVRLGILPHSVPWLAQPSTAMAGVIVAVMWQGFPFFAVTLLAGLQAIPGELYEAAAIDGAGAWGKFRHITLPGLAGVIATALLLRMIWVANSLDLILVMTGGGPGTSTHTLPLHAFLTAWSGGNYGQGSALAVLLTLLLLGVVVTYVWRSRGE